MIEDMSPSPYSFYVDDEFDSQDVDLSQNDKDRLDLKKQEAERYAQDTKERKYLSHWVVRLVSWWLPSVLFVITLNKLLRFDIDNVVLCTLLGTTTINILGLAFIILKGLFNVESEKEKSKEDSKK